MRTTVDKLQKLHGSVQKLETVLQEVWSLIDEIGEDEEFKNLMKQAKQYKTKKQNGDKSMEELCEKIDEFDNRMEEIPEDGTAAVDFEDAVSELIEWIQENK
ncbi:MAG TPA: hypothetical protein VK190_03855 [Pseudoneobacillus sp.]|nr:hypothetical protein [Pseudoneobacillus sp.]